MAEVPSASKAGVVWTAALPSRPPTLRPLGSKPRKQAEAERKGRIDRARSGDPIRALYKTAAWQQLRKTQLFNEPLCRACSAAGRLTAASVVDHKKPHRGDTVKFHDPDNLQSLCKRCHDSKTGREHGGFGKAT